MPSTEIELRGHIIDSYLLPRVWAAITEAGGRYLVREMRVGTSESEPSYARLEVVADSDVALDDLLRELERLGGAPMAQGEARTELVTRPGVLPDDFYATTNLPTEVHLNGAWVPVVDIEMDVAIVVDRAAGTARAVPMHEARVGNAVVVGHDGVRVIPLGRPREREIFGFMQNPVSSERAKAQAMGLVTDAELFLSALVAVLGSDSRLE
jgi:hypothetical protein